MNTVNDRGLVAVYARWCIDVLITPKGYGRVARLGVASTAFEHFVLGTVRTGLGLIRPKNQSTLTLL